MSNFILRGVRAGPLRGLLARGRCACAPEPAAPSRTPIAISEGRYGTIPRTYIELLEDRAVTPMLQKRMHSAMPCAVRSIAASHSAYFSKPDELTAHLDEIAAHTSKPFAPAASTQD